jgi:hypothetical protein
MHIYDYVYMIFINHIIISIASIADKILLEELNGQTYDEEEAKIWSLNISDKVREAVFISISKSRYKIVVQTNVGQLRDQGIRIASRCLWEPNTDNYASTSYSNVSKEFNCCHIQFADIFSFINIFNQIY